MNKKIPIYEGLTDNTNIPNIFDQIVDLDLKYGKYIQCNNSEINPNNVLNCSSDDMNIETINKAYATLMGNNYSSNNGSLVNALNAKTMSKEEYNKNLNYIINKHEEILKLRNDLDLKTQELNMINNPVYRDNKIKHDASVYSGVLWTILASSILYYLFIKL